MLFTDIYHTIKKPTEAEYKDRGSRFIGLAFHIENETQAKEIVDKLKTEHPSADHHCWAFVLGKGGEFQKSSDDREPNNTAGKPILRAILSMDITHILVVVVRYFGGKQLGVPGLIEAYGNTAALALQKAEKTEHVIMETHKICFDYEYEGLAFNLLKQHSATILTHEFNNNKIEITFDIRKSVAQNVLQVIYERRMFEMEFVHEH